MRRAEKALIEECSAPNRNGNGHDPEIGGLRLRANIKLAKIHDQQRADDVATESDQPELRGRLVSDDRVTNVFELFAGAGGMGLGFLQASAEAVSVGWITVFESSTPPKSPLSTSIP